MAKTVRRNLFLAAAFVVVLAVVFGVAMAMTGGVANAIDDGEPEASPFIQIDLSNFNELHWVLKGYESDLRDGRVYEYSYKEDAAADEVKHYYTLQQLSSAPNPAWVNWQLVGSVNTMKSIMRYRPGGDFNHEIVVFGDQLGTSFDVEGSYVVDFSAGITNIATEPGKYTAQVLLKAKDGYEFSLKNTGSAGLNMTARGMSIELISNDADDDALRGNTYARVTKEWYVCNYDNALLDGPASIEEVKEVEYDIKSWEFGKGEPINYPWLQHGDAALNGGLWQGTIDHDFSHYVLKVGDVVIARYDENQSKVALLADWDPTNPESTHDVLTFTLYRTSDGTKREIVKDATRSQWAYYINEYMPVGHYSVEITVATVTLSSHPHWWNPGDFHEENGGLESDYIGFERVLNFDVTPGTLTLNDDEVNFATLTEAEKEEKNFEVNVADIFCGNAEKDYSAFFAPAKQIGVEFPIGWDDVRRQRKGGYWATRDDLYDAQPTLVFNLYRMKNNVYHNATSAEWSKYITAPDTYTVYYMAEMKNYQSNPLGGNERYLHYFDMDVYREIPLPNLNRNELVYTGGQLIVGPADMTYAHLYTWSGNRQTDAGDYEVTFVFNDTAHYKWAGHDYGDNYTVDFTIKPMVVETPTLATRYYTGNSITPAIVIPKNQNTTRDIFSVTYPQGYSSGRFENAGTYQITLTLDSETNYVWSTEKDKANPAQAIQVPFVINPQENTWAIRPSIRHWQWGAFDREVISINGLAMQGVTKFTITTDSAGLNPANGLEDFFAVDGKVTELTGEVIGNLNAGTYYLVAKVDASANYTGLTSVPVRFDVGLARNYWDDTPNIIRWTYGGFDPAQNVITGAAHFARSVKYSVIGKNGDIEEVIIDNIQLDADGVPQGDSAAALQALGAGTYYLRAEVIREVGGYVGNSSTPTYNYTELVSDTEFHVQMATNQWIETPNIQRWIIGEQIYEPTGTPRFGVAQFVITDTDGTEIYNSATGLNNLVTAHPGWHTLTATVASDNRNYSALSSSTRFRVFGTEINFWREVPNIQGWVVGEEANLPTSMAAFGTVEYTYTDINGNVLSGVPTEIGEYYLVATAKSDEHEDLIARVKFTISPLSEAQQRETALITSVSVLGALLFCCIIVAIVVPIVIKKKNKPVKAKPFKEDDENI